MSKITGNLYLTNADWRFVYNTVLNYFNQEINLAYNEAIEFWNKNNNLPTQDFLKLLNDKIYYRDRSIKSNVFGSGKTSNKIYNIINKVII